MAIGIIATTSQGKAIQCDDGTECLLMPGVLPAGPDFALGKRVAFDKKASPYPGRFFATNVRKPNFAELASAQKGPAPAPGAKAQPVAPIPAPPVPAPESIIQFQADAASFKGWVQRQASLVSSHPHGLKFVYAPKYELKDGTISVPITIHRNGAAVPRTTFYFHYHPGAAGARVGHGYASTWHFKPSDGAQKHIRIEDHDFKNISGNLVRESKEKARS